MYTLYIIIIIIIIIIVVIIIYNPSTCTYITGIVDQILNWAKYKQTAELKKKSGNKRSKLVGKYNIVYNVLVV